MSKHVLITGGAGFVGSTLSLGLKKRYPDWHIIALDNLRRRGSELNLARLKEAGVEFMHGDIRNSEDLQFQQLDVVIDASADPSVLSGIDSDVRPLIQTNLNGTANCLEVAHKHQAQFIFLSTSRVYPIRALEQARFEELDSRFQWTNDQEIRGISAAGVREDFPLEGSRSFYGTTKLASELIITEYQELKNLKTIINRCGVISGPWQMGKVDQGVLVLWLARHFFKGELAYIGYGGSGKQMRDVMHADDLLDLIDLQIQRPDLFNGKIVNAGGGLDCSFSLQELTKWCELITGNSIKIHSIAENRTADIRIYVSDATALYQLSGWKPKRTLEHIVQDTFAWLKQNESHLKSILS